MQPSMFRRLAELVGDVPHRNSLVFDNPSPSQSALPVVRTLVTLPKFQKRQVWKVLGVEAQVGSERLTVSMYQPVSV